ncbi:hypothetical protein BDN72DRAFT_395449 [Pluteus cervinus]|uniref:Uncharacterized protein n=1 Tax=Pluteus cervinus TaxID=181527 RepID=A0ACD3AAJ6_9AGAR|nr:hypothetical protein BDN72DRAFT_395449 [Pluteus cervinus]
MNLTDHSIIQTQNAVFNNTINNFSSSSERATKRRSAEDARVRAHFANYAVKGASFDAAERGELPKCHPDTRTAVQNSLIAWRGNRTAGPVRLISGWAGTGKTTIAQTLAEYWAKQGQLGGSFFFSRSSGARSETGLVATTLLHQFLQTFGADMDLGSNTRSGAWDTLVELLVSTSPSLPQPVVIVIDGLDECSSTDRQVSLLRQILSSLDRLGSSIKFLISCRPERHLENIFNEFAPKLGSSYRIYLGQSPEDNDDIRTFFRVSFDRICQDRRNDGAMSITDGPWPSQEEVEELVDRASGQFIFAATAIRFVDDETEDPVEMLNLILERRTSSFSAIDQLYVVILDRVVKKLDQNKKSLELRELMHNLILHINHQPSSPRTIADFWFEKEVTINILVKHLQALLVRNTTTHSEDLIQFRHKSFHDFLARPSESHPFSLVEMNPVSRFFFALRTHSKEVAYRPRGWALQPSQWLGYTFYCCDDHPPAVFPYEEARRLHQAYVQDRATFRGCICLPRLEAAILDIHALRTIKSCGQDDCVINSDLLTLCQRILIPIDDFTREWEKRDCLRTISFNILKFLLWLRVILYSLVSDPSFALYESIQALLSGCSSSTHLVRHIAIVNGFICMMILLHIDILVLLHVFHIIATFLLHRFLHFDGL